MSSSVDCACGGESTSQTFEFVFVVLIFRRRSAALIQCVCWQCACSQYDRLGETPQTYRTILDMFSLQSLLERVLCPCQARHI